MTISIDQKFWASDVDWIKLVWSVQTAGFYLRHFRIINELFPCLSGDNSGTQHSMVCYIVLHLDGNSGALPLSSQARLSHCWLYPLIKTPIYLHDGWFYNPPRFSIGVILWFHQETIINPSILYESRWSLKNSRQNHLFSSPKNTGDVPYPGALRVDAGGNCFFELFKGRKNTAFLTHDFGVYSWGMCEFYWFLLIIFGKLCLG